MVLYYRKKQRQRALNVQSAINSSNIKSGFRNAICGSGLLCFIPELCNSEITSRSSRYMDSDVPSLVDQVQVMK